MIWGVLMWFGGGRGWELGVLKGLGGVLGVVLGVLG